jgi:hypothetical protein
MGRPRTDDRASALAASANISRRTIFYGKKAARSPFVLLAVEAGRIAPHNAAFLAADCPDEMQKWALEPVARKDVLRRVKILRIAQAIESGLPSAALSRLQMAWSKAANDDRRAFLTWIADAR